MAASETNRPGDPLRGARARRGISAQSVIVSVSRKRCPWLAAIASIFIFPERMTFGSQVLVMVMFALSLDLILGYAGIVTLGHAAFFGIGAYTVGLAAARLGWSEPISGTFRGRDCGRACRLHHGLVPAALSRLTLLMLTLATAILLQETGNLRSDISGGYDGLPGLTFNRYSAYSTTTSTVTHITCMSSPSWWWCSSLSAGSSIRPSGRR